VHTPLAQSAEVAQPAFDGHGVQPPPQSTSVSIPLCTPSVQLGVRQVPLMHTKL
jgi:hypothetical protein